MRFPILILGVTALAHAQIAFLRPASTVTMPTPMVDGNSPGFWHGDTLTVFTSTGYPVSMSGPGLLNLGPDVSPVVQPGDHYPLWIEAVWTDEDGTVYAWYHHEPGGVCSNNKLTAPRIGALVSTDAGRTFQDLGIVLSSGDPVNCGAQNGFFAGGNGDISVILDQNREYFYFLFTNYGGAPENQGVSIARMAFADRANPAGMVQKYYQGEWSEPGLGGRVTPVFPAVVPWERSNTDSFWGPAVHWNTSLNQYVLLLNHACCKPNWPQEGIYITFNPDLSNPSGWTQPYRLIDAKQIGFAPGYYPQVFGLGEQHTDTLAGEVARFFIKGVSKWEIVFFE
ncbi:MAG: hypothetical protein M1436_09495 [Acidobacteria bacterium]|nr:hypothetical protein [Acidobacteriota bacterium]